MTGAAAQAVLVRHTETEWTLSGQHTGRTDVPLTEHGREAARGLAERLAGCGFALVLVSPARRALETCELCGLADDAQVRDDLREWDYGEYEGLTSAEIELRRPGWSLWRDGCPGGEDAAAVGARADHVIAELAGAAGAVAIFSHGHMLRVLGARWVELAPEAGARLGLAPGSVSRLGAEHGTPIIASWNAGG
ncbi:MAG: histidine phosphatase family protein [Solirubrobacterales bacterium]|nr:histidine phosphatase family protein [Solirubrobacterales bacterium]